MDFIAIDFETANSNLNSACSMGIAVVKDFEIIEEKYFLIKPPSEDFSDINIRVHGITYEDVKDSLSFSELWPSIIQYFNNTIVIAHNASFDMSVLKNCLEYYNLELPDFTYLDSMYISDLGCDCKNVDRKLVSRADYFGIPIENHHNALNDAKVAAQIVISTIKQCNSNSFTRFCLIYLAGKSKEFKDIKARKQMGKSFRNFNKSIKISELVATTNEFDPEHPFFNKSIVLTGNLISLTRELAMQNVVNIGGKIKSSVSKNTDYLVVGKQDLSIVGEDGMSGKEEKAYKLIEQGVEIKILNETDFLNLLNI